MLIKEEIDGQQKVDVNTKNKGGPKWGDLERVRGNWLIYTTVLLLILLLFLFFLRHAERPGALLLWQL